MELKNEWIQEDDVYENPLLKITLNGLKYYGILLYKTQPLKKLNCFRGVVFTASMLAFNVTQYIDLYQVWGNIGDMTANAATTLLFTTTIVRIFHFYGNRTRFNNAIKYADEGVQHVLRFGMPAEKAIFWQNVKYMQRLTAVFWICALVTANTMCIYALIQYLSNTVEEPATILRSWYPAENMEKHFLVLYCIQLYIMYVGQLIVPCWHVFMVSLMVYVRTSLMILNHKLAHMDEYVASGMRSGRKPQVVKDPTEESYATRRELIIECIQQQRKVYGYTIELEDLIKGAVFMDFVVFSVLLCALLFEASVTDSMVQIFIDISYILTMTAILFLYYWHANEMQHQANLLSKSTFMSDWYNYPRVVNRHLITLICYCNRPLTMKAFFLPMSLDTFIAILRASYSYFTILKQAAD
ncbi:odorant receptor 56a [Toxorhynchites rutilus septentrionalis]|uniref:odorant receptor 56a n=1 Tax=Toxorhynchites rutilus septentrionalis TaxID=329112 RepID=UPI00247A63AE|nr:odorant receptor 56a [Toxorhynchites rutilus septentrionalis]